MGRRWEEKARGRCCTADNVRSECALRLYCKAVRGARGSRRRGSPGVELGETTVHVEYTFTENLPRRHAVAIGAICPRLRYAGEY